MNTFRTASLLRSHAPRSHRSRVSSKAPPAATTTSASQDTTLHSERHHGRWEIHYRLEPAFEKFAGSAQIHCDGASHCELPIFEPQPNALASIDLLREQCLAWIAHRAEGLRAA